MTSPHGHDAASTVLLTLAVAVLGLGPILFRLSRERRWLLPVVDGFVLASVGALAAMFVLPEAVRVGGPGVLLLAGAGLLLPSVLEKFSSRHQLVHGVGLLFALVGLLAHTVTDGVALSAGGGAARALALAVVLHRIPVALAAWWLVRPLYGVAGAWIVLSLEGIGTIVGFFLGDFHVVEFSGVGLAAFQAFVSGALLHVVIHRPAGPRSPPGQARFYRLSETGGAVLGAALV
ncbi:MAG: hypothetical protein ACO3JL_13570, partial [Myxococcota bacterium]